MFEWIRLKKFMNIFSEQAKIKPFNYLLLTYMDRWHKQLSHQALYSWFLFFYSCWNEIESYTHTHYVCIERERELKGISECHIFTLNDSFIVTETWWPEHIDNFLKGNINYPYRHTHTQTCIHTIFLPSKTWKKT